MKMDYEKEYKDALSKAREFYNNEQTHVGMTPIDIKSIFPELKQGVERIRKAISQCVEDMRGQFEKLYGVHHKDAIAWIEKQGEPAKLSEEEQNRFAKGVLSSCALSFINYLDAHRYEGKMCVSNGECEDIENAFHNAMWDRLHRYYCKYVEKQTNTKNTKAKDFSENREDLSEFYKQVCHIAASLLNKEYDYTMDTIEWYAYRLLECAKKELEKQKPIMNVPSIEVILSIWDLGNEWKELTGGSISTKYGTQLEYIQRHWQESEYYLKAKRDEQQQCKSTVEAVKEENVDNANLLLTVPEEFYSRMFKNCTVKVKPKFKAGDWIVHNGDSCICQIKSIREDEYCVWPLDSEVEGYLKITDIDNKYHLWTIKDAKNGDVLVRTNDILSICIFSRFDGINNKFSSFLCHCGLEGKGLGQELSINGYHDDSENYVPATKEQRDILFSKIKEAGYAWNAEKKELKKIEENSSDKVEPKFRKGQWIVWQDKCYKVNYNGCGYVLVDQNGLSTSLKYGTIDENAHLWDITKDVKNGDVLAEDTCTFIIKKLNNDLTGEVYCCLFDDGDFDLIGSTLGFFDEDSTYPATKEQRDILFAKMKEAGYEWDVEKKELKELKKIEQKPTDKVERKFKVGDWIINHNVIYHIDKISGVYVTLSTIDGTALVYHISVLDSEYTCLWTLQDAKEGDVLDANGAPFIYKKHNTDYVYCYCGVNLGGDFIEAKGFDTWNNNYKVYPATKEQHDLLFAKMKEAGYEWDAEKKELTKIEQNLWSEEDKRKLNRIYSILGEAADTHAFSTSCRLIGDKECIELQDFLKSIVYQNIWKPSDEQMLALRQVISGCSYDVEPLLELETKLKNLKFNENNSI